MKLLFGPEHIRVAHYYYILGQIYQNIGNINNAKENYQEALRILKKQNFSELVLVKGNQNNILIVQKCLTTLKSK